MSLITTPNFSAPDDLYEALINAHQDLSIEESQAFNARLVLLLANHIGSFPVIQEALQAARKMESM
jgi:HD-like signal output (HDOD) protein